METALRLLGDGVTIAALSIIWGASRVIWRRAPADARLPAPWGGRAPRALALGFTPTVAAAVLLTLTFWGLADRDMDATRAVMLFGARGVLTALFGLAHLTHLRAVLQDLGTTAGPDGANEP
jgi:hypothetical protein